MSVAELSSSRGDGLQNSQTFELDDLAASVRGRLIGPTDPGYDQARRVWNGMIDKFPALIVPCTGTADVVAAVNFARENALPIAVRGAGHNVAGNAVCDGGLVIDLSGMKGVNVYPSKRTARAQPGVTWGELNHETQLFGLATPGGEVSTTGIAGYTLSGGLGQLQRKWGLACDNLLSVEIVTAEGQVLEASVAQYADLFWAVRGGGGNFGIVTWFEYQLHPLGPDVYSATTFYSLDDANAVLRAWRAYTQQVPDEVTSEALFWTMPPLPDLPEDLHGSPVLVTAGLYAGSPEAGEQALKPLRELARPLADLSGVASYSQTQSASDDAFPAGLHYYWKSLFTNDLGDEIVNELCELAADRPSPQSLFAIRHLGGAIAHTADDATAYGNRRAAFNVSLDSTWDDPLDNQRIIGWTRTAWARLRDVTGEGAVYLNFAGLGEDNALLARAGYGSNYDRLREVKRLYDPQNLFRGNVNVTP